MATMNEAAGWGRKNPTRDDDHGYLGPSAARRTGRSLSAAGPCRRILSLSDDAHAPCRMEGLSVPLRRGHARQAVSALDALLSANGRQKPVAMLKSPSIPFDSASRARISSSHQLPPDLASDVRHCVPCAADSPPLPRWASHPDQTAWGLNWSKHGLCGVIFLG
jgi:hypothetical protein